MSVRLIFCPGSACITHGQLSAPYPVSLDVMLAMFPSEDFRTAEVDMHFVKAGVTTRNGIKI